MGIFMNVIYAAYANIATEVYGNKKSRLIALFLKTYNTGIYKSTKAIY
jgi:hypothetical protein